MSNDQAWVSLITLVNSSTSAGYDSYVVGSSSRGTHVLATGRRCRPSNEESQPNIAVSSPFWGIGHFSPHSISHTIFPILQIIKKKDCDFQSA